MDTSGFKHTPKTKTALITAIREEIKRQGSSADLNCIDTSAITNMRELFNKFKTFDGDISEWDVSNVKDMTDMFRDSDFRGDISGWNVDKVEYFFPMFCYCRIADDHKPARFRRNRPADAPVLEGKLNWMDVSFSLSGDGVCVVSGNLSKNHGYSFLGGCDLAELPVKHLIFAEGVTEIGDYTFREWNSIEELTLPSSLTRIGNDAFGWCRNIKRIHFSEGLQEIGSSAFGSCPVCKLDLPKTLTKIGGYAFSGFDQLVELDLPDSIVSIGTRAFRDCSSLRTVKLPAHLKVISESLFSQCKALEQVQMPEDLERIEGYAFLDCPNLKSVTLPDSVSYIAHDAFESEEFDDGGLHYSITNYITNVNDCEISAKDWDGKLDIPSSVSHEGRTFVVNSMDFYSCKRLTGVSIPDTFSTIPDCAFAGCKSLREVEIPSSVTTIGAEAFRGCEALKSIELPDAVTEIAENLFKGCWRLRKVRFGSNVTTIGNSAFKDCEFLQQFPLPDSVRRIERSAFENCKNLVDLGQPSSLEYVGLYALNNTAMRLIQDGPIYIGNALCGYSGDMPDHACLEVRNGTTTVAEAALRGQRHLESVIFPESLRIIWYEAFNECRDLKNIHLPKSLNFVGDCAFDGSAVDEVEVPWEIPIEVGYRPFPNSTQVYVPTGSLAAYTEAKYWKNYKLQEKENCESDPSGFITDDTVFVGREKKRRVVLVEKPQRKSPWNLYGAIVPAEPDIDARKIVKDLLFEAFRDTARYLDLTDWSGDSYSPAEEMEYSSQRFAVFDLPEGAAPQTQTFDGRTYLTDEAFYNSLLSGGVQWEPLVMTNGFTGQDGKA
ncbi:MAG: leucine-rich repeat protein [Bacteroidales bacterium]|nr:leucine-rich repeat protein [Bacteroidales bacterium]